MECAFPAAYCRCYYELFFESITDVLRLELLFDFASAYFINCVYLLENGE
jgi:hypothetical protein